MTPKMNAPLVRPVQPLLFWQVLACAWVTGAAAFWWTEILLVPVLILWVDARARHPLRVVALLLCVATGFGWAQWRAPAWPTGNIEQLLALRSGTLTGTVADVRGQYDRRLSVIMQNAAINGIPLPGGVAWTREGTVSETAPERPIAGEVVRFEGRLRAVADPEKLKTPGTADGIARYWLSRGVFWQVWTPASVPVQILHAEARPGLFRGAVPLEQWRSALVSRLNALYPDNPPSLRYGQAAPSAPHGWGLLPAVIFGDRYYLGADDTQRLQRAGLTHSIALSGQHLAVTGLLAAALLWLWGRFRPGVFLRVPRFTLTLWCALPLAGLYLWMGNAPPSLQRAVIMLTCWAVACTLRRPAAFTDGLVAALVCMVLIDPAGLADVGLQLSFGAVAGLALAAPLLGRWFVFSAGKPLIAGAGATFLSSVVIQVTLLPLVLVIFGWVTPWAWLNILWLPVLGLWVLPLGFLGTLSLGLPGIMAGFTDILLLAATEPCFWLVEGLAWLDARAGLAPTWCLRPHWLAFTGFVCAMGALSLSLGRRRVPRAAVRLCVTGLLLLFCGPFLRMVDGFSGEVRLRLLDVGQGQAALLEFPGEQRVLVDGGGFSSPRFDSGRDLIAPVLTENRPPRLTAIALSHADLDHLRGLLFLARYFDIGSVLLPAQAPGSGHDTAAPLLRKFEGIIREQDIPVRRLSRDDQIVIPGISGSWLETLAPIPGRPAADNDGLVLRLVMADNFADNAPVDVSAGLRGLAILPGDATKSLLTAMVRAGSKENAMRAEVLVAPHHGSRNNVQEGFVRAVNPSVILASCAKNNRYGFPSDELRELCATLDIPLRATADEGEITWNWILPAHPVLPSTRPAYRK